MSSQCVFISKTEIDKTLSTESTQGKRLLEPLKSISQGKGTPINVLEDNNVSNEAEVHRHEGDLWICLEGEVEFIVGGEMVGPWIHQKSDGTKNELEIKAKEIKDGEHHILSKGDILWIPAGEPHLHRTLGIARLFIIKIPARENVSLRDVPGWHL